MIFAGLHSMTPRIKKGEQVACIMTTKGDHMRTPKFVLTFIIILSIACSIPCSAQQTVSAKIGGALGSISADDFGNQKKPSEQHYAPSATASELVGLYELVSFTVTYRSGTVIRSSDYQFYGDMAITSHSTLWQRIALSGFEVIALSGIFSVNGNNFYSTDDFYSESSSGTYSWDGTYLRTTVYDGTVPDPFTEIDVWRRVLSGNGTTTVTKTIIIPIF
jgi:hypothetical protein